MKPLIAPSILSFNLLTLNESVPHLERGGADRLHLDVMDGQFVPPISFGDGLVRALRPLVGMPLEAHLMTQTPERHFEAFAEAGCQGIIFHYEATSHAHRLCQQLRSMGLKAGMAINPATPVDVFDGVRDVLDLALVMTINPGWGGQPILPATLDKVRALHARHPSLAIEVDGGIDRETIRSAWQAGARVFVVGNHLARSEHLSEAIGELEAACG